MSAIALALLLLLSACDRAPVAVRVSIPNVHGVETPVPDLVLTFVPYDRDSVLRALERKIEPRPHTQELDSLFRAFREPFNAYLAATLELERLQAARDSLARGGPGDPEGSRNPRLAAIRDSLAALEPARQRARTALDQARTALWPRMDSLRQAIHQWEARAYAGYEAAGKELNAHAGVNPVSDTTDAGGWASITIPAGHWWVTGRTIDPVDPNAEWYWNVPVAGDTVRLDPRSGKSRAQY